MSYASLLSELKILCPDSYDVAAPAGLTRFVVAHRYAESSVYADDSNVWDFPRVQIDVYTQSPDDSLPEDVKLLLRTWCCPYTVQSMAWDDDTALWRTILQTEVISA